MKVACLQLNAIVGDFAANSAKLCKAYDEAVRRGAELVLAPELFLCGYPPRDLLTHRDFMEMHDRALQKVVDCVESVPLVTGILALNPHRPGKMYFNAAAVIENRDVRTVIHKRLLPTYDVFDEDRYFQPGIGSDPVLIGGKRVGITICEDIWNDEDFWPERLYRSDPVKDLVAKGIDLLVNISASPWHTGKHGTRLKMISEVALREKIPVVQVNVVGGNDELVFDGQSLMVDAQGRMLARGNAFDEDLLMGNPFSDEPIPETGHQPSVEEEIFYALALGTGDYVRKCGFQKVAIGLSGGIDSALTAVIAVEALGNENVLGVLMPGPYSSEGSLKDARALAEVLEIQTMTLPIGGPFEAVSKQLQPVLGGLVPDSTEENLQSRLRGVTLMAISNKQNRLVLTTGNKSELAVGYCTLYGDMCGGLAVISDLPKMTVYSLSRWINRHGEIIPRDTLDKAPSAELRPNQTDQDSLPPYDILDAIVEGYVVRGETPAQIAARGIDPRVVHDIIRKIDLNEYKRRQAAPGLKVTSKAFGIGRRMPIAQRFRRK